jgi:hypothetical protein
MNSFPKQCRTEDKLLREWIKKFPCSACRKVGTEYEPIDPSHVLTRGAGRPDTWYNLVPQCRTCHGSFESNRLGFIDSHPRFWTKLRAMGWDLIDSVGKKRLWHPYLEKEDP